jgi:hypothetical protein
MTPQVNRLRQAKGLTRSRNLTAKLLFLAVALLTASSIRAKEFAGIQPVVREHNVFVAHSRGLAGEIKATARDLSTFRDPRWSLLTLAQIGAAAADAKTSLDNFRQYPSREETGPARLLIGRHPDAHKYVIAGLVEIGVEAVAAHYLRNHIPPQKWYWRYAWSLPQTFSLYQHTRASLHNVRLGIPCDETGLSCY